MFQLKLTVAVIFILISGISAADIKCVKCDTSEACISLDKIETVDCPTNKCFTKIGDDGTVSRGCSAEGAEDCTTGTCLTCKDDQCNNNRICKGCTSADPNFDCAQTDSTNPKYNTICAAKDTKCIKKIDDKFQVVRACASSTDTEQTCSGDTCALCEGPNCNTGVFPVNRQRCYQCNDLTSDCGDVFTGNIIVSKPCLFYKSTDVCYTSGTSDTAMKRGCLSELADPKTCEDDSKCVTCDTANCNSRAYEYLPYKCIKCNNADKCQWGQTVAPDDCDKILYSDEGGCYTETFENKTVARGCIRERTTEGECKGNCTACTGDGCNNINTAVFSCIRCRSDEDARCKNVPKTADNVNDGKCRNLVTEADAKCFSGLWNNVVIRGCFVDLNSRQVYECSKTDNKDCKTCPGESNCNTHTGLGGAAAVKITSGLFMGILIVLWRLH